MQLKNQVIPDEFTINVNEEGIEHQSKKKRMNYLEIMVEKAKLKFKLKKEKSPPTPTAAGASSDAVIIINVCFAYFSKLLNLNKLKRK